MTVTHCRLFKAFLLCACAFITPVLAQPFPSKPITIYIGTSPGGTQDAIARVLAQRFEKKWGQNVLVESRQGGGGLVAFGALARAAPDGHTLLIGGSATQTLFVRDAGFDFFKDITAISILAQSPYVLLVGRNARIGTLADFIARAKANPGAVNFGVIPSSTHENETLELQRVLGIRGSVVGYRGIAPVYLALIANEIQATMGTNTPQIKSGKMIALAVGGDTRLPELPDVPTFRELGFRYNPAAAYLLSTRAGAPSETINRIFAEAADATRSEEFAARVTRPFAIYPLATNPEASTRFIREDYDRNKAIMESHGIKPQ